MVILNRCSHHLGSGVFNSRRSSSHTWPVEPSSSSERSETPLVQCNNHQQARMLPTVMIITNQFQNEFSMDYSLVLSFLLSFCGTWPSSSSSGSMLAWSKTSFRFRLQAHAQMPAKARIIRINTT